MSTLIGFLVIFIFIYTLCVLIWALISWLPMFSPSLAFNPTVTSVRRFLDSIVEPYIAIFRRIIPPVNLGGAQVDLSALVGIIVLQVVSRLLGSIAG